MLIPTLTLLLQTAMPAPLSPDSVEALRKEAERAERAYEILLRRLAPETRSWSSGGQCDEIVGRFCLRFGEGEPPPMPPEPEGVDNARSRAVETLRGAFSAAPGDPHIAGVLLRFLVEDSREEEAISAARTFAWATEEKAWGHMLLGFTLHYAGQDSAAGREFDQAIAAFDEEDRERFTDIGVLLDYDERRLYEDLEDGEQRRYEAEFWRLSDALYLLPGNSGRNEHLTRWVWSRLLSEAPRVSGSHRWGGDLEELTLRYGVPKGRERIRSTSLLYDQSSLSQRMVERYDPDQLALVPTSLRTEGMEPAPTPGDSAEIGRRRARTRHNPPSLRRLVPLGHQVSRFPVGDSVTVRVDAALPLDSVALDPESEKPAGDRIDAALFLLDERYEPAGRLVRSLDLRGDTIPLALELTVPAGEYVYSLEALEPGSLLAGRARHPVELTAPEEDSPALSDILVSHAFGDAALPDSREHATLRPRHDLVLPEAETLGIYAEVHGLRIDADGGGLYRADLSVHDADDPSAPVRAIRWLGRTLGITGEPTRPRIAWEAATEGDGPGIIAVDLDLADLGTGLYVLQLEITDLVSQSSAQTRRIFRIEN